MRKHISLILQNKTIKLQSLWFYFEDFPLAVPSYPLKGCKRALFINLKRSHINAPRNTSFWREKVKKKSQSTPEQTSHTHWGRKAHWCGMRRPDDDYMNPWWLIWRGSPESSECEWELLRTCQDGSENAHRACRELRTAARKNDDKELNSGLKIN